MLLIRNQLGEMLIQVPDMPSTWVAPAAGTELEFMYELPDSSPKMRVKLTGFVVTSKLNIIMTEETKSSVLCLVVRNYRALTIIGDNLVTAKVSEIRGGS